MERRKKEKDSQVLMTLLKLAMSVARDVSEADAAEMLKYYEYALSVYDIRDNYFPNYSVLEIATALNLSNEEIEDLLEKDKSYSGVLKNTSLSSLRKDYVTVFGETPPDSLTKIDLLKLLEPSKKRKSRKKSKTVAQKEPRKIRSEDVDPLAKYMELEKPQRPVLISKRKVKSAECPMISSQQILDKLREVKADTPSSTSVKFEQRPPGALTLGPESEKISEILAKDLGGESPITKRVFAIIGSSHDGKITITKSEYSNVLKYLENTTNGFIQIMNPLTTSTFDTDRTIEKIFYSDDDVVYRILDERVLVESKSFDYSLVAVTERSEKPDGFVEDPKTLVNRRTEVFLNSEKTIWVGVTHQTGERESYELELEVIPRTLGKSQKKFGQRSQTSVETGKKTFMGIGFFKTMATPQDLHDLALKLLSEAKGVEIKAKAPPSTSRIVDAIFKNLTETKTDKKSEVEVEASLGTFFGNSFTPGVTFEGFARLKKFLEKKNYSTSVKPEVTKVEIDGYVRAITFFGKDGEQTNTIYQRKERNKVYDSPTYGYRISSSIETSIEKPEKFFPHLTRMRSRTTYLHPSGNAKIDMTEVQEGESKKFEVEIELLPESSLLSKKSKVMDLQTLYDLLLKFLVITEGVGNSSELMTRQEYSRVVTFHNSALGVYGRKEGQMTKNYLNKPINLKIDDLLKRVHNTAITNKLDGERAVLIITTHGVYSYVRDLLTKIGVVNSTSSSSKDIEYNTFILDCELTVRKGVKTFWPFDALAAGKDALVEDVRGLELVERDRIRRIVGLDSTVSSSITLWGSTTIDVSKTYYYPEGSSFYAGILEAEKWERKHPKQHFDGFIFQPLGAYLNDSKSGQPRKWKPVDKMTIDFKAVLVDSQKAEYELLTFSSRMKKYVRPRLFAKGNKVSPLIHLPMDFSSEYDEDRSVSPNNIVVECKFDSNSNSFKIYRLRPDKPYPNEEGVVKSVFSDIIKPLSLETLKGQNLVIMRKAHNQTKNFLLKNFQGKKAILDLGSGQGGDIKKWAELGISKVYAMEPSSEMQKEFIKRYESLPDDQKVEVNLQSFKAQNTNEIVELLSEEKTKVQGVSAFFSLTFLGGAKKDIQALGRTVNSVLLREGERFVGIVMDGEEVHQLLDLTKGKYISSVDGEVLYSIIDTKERSEITSGFESRKIIVDIPGSNVRNVEEWTFPFSYFSRVMREHGFKLESDGFLSPSGKASIGVLFGKKSKEANPTQNLVDKVYQDLPEESRVFSSLQRFFIFKRGRGGLESLSENITLPTRNQNTDFYQNIQGIDFVEEHPQLEYVIQNSSSIFAAYLDLIDEGFYAPAKTEGQLERIEFLQNKLKRDKNNKEVIKALETAKGAGKTDGFETKAVKSFRTGPLKDFVLNIDEDALPFEEGKDVRIDQRYGGLKKMAQAFSDPSEEIPIKDAVEILSWMATDELGEQVVILILGPKGLVYASDCEGAEKVMIIYQTFSEASTARGQRLAADIRSTQHLYFPIIPVNSKERLFSTSEENVRKLLNKICPTSFGEDEVEEEVEEIEEDQSEETEEADEEE